MRKLTLFTSLTALLLGCQSGSKQEAPQEPPTTEVAPRPVEPNLPEGMTPNPPDGANPSSPSPPPVVTPPLDVKQHATPTEISDNPLYPGQELIALRPAPGALEVMLADWLACDGVFEMKSRRTGRTITVDVVDNNSSMERVSCTGDTRVSTRIENLPPGRYRVTIHPGKGHRPLTGEATVEAAAK